MEEEQKQSTSRDECEVVEVMVEYGLLTEGAEWGEKRSLMPITLLAYLTSNYRFP